MRKWLKPLLLTLCSIFLLGSIIFLFIIETVNFDTDKKIGSLLAEKITDETGLDIKFDRIKISLFNKPNIRINRLTIFDKNLILLSAKDLSINIGSLIRFGTNDLFNDLWNKNLLIENISSTEITIPLKDKQITLINTQLELSDHYFFKDARFVIPLKAELNLKTDKLLLSNTNSKYKEVEAENFDLMAKFDLMKLKADIKFSSNKIQYQKVDLCPIELKNSIGDIKLQKNRLDIRVIADENITDQFKFDSSLLIGFSLFDPNLIDIKKFRVNKFITKKMKIEREIFFRYVSILENRSDK